MTRKPHRGPHAKECPLADPFILHTPVLDPAAGRLTARYGVPGFGEFSETVEFPAPLPPGPATEALAGLAAAVMGTSYFKLAPASEIRLAMPAGPALLALILDTYTHGLGEFHVRNGLPFPPALRLVAEPVHGSGAASIAAPASLPPAASGPLAARRAIVAFGGGKDSHVAMDLVAWAGIEAEPVSVILAERVGARLVRMLPASDGRPLTLIRRTIDPRLIALAREGQGLNGHIPITAINSALLALHAHARGAEQVVFANERAASAPTLHLEDGTPVNHQHSKSLGYEALLRDVLATVPGLELAYYSILRPASELWTIRHLVRHCEGALDVFASCNRNFVFGGPDALAADRNWCGACAKCVYTGVLLASVLPPGRVEAVMRAAVFARGENEHFLRELAGISPVKPWECVGEIEEVAAALDRILGDPAWAGQPVLDAVRADFRSRWPDQRALAARYAASHTLTGDHFIPAEVFAAMAAAG